MHYINVKKKLYAATAMLLISAVVFAQSTFAWFTLSTSPEATGITSQVGSNGSLEIALLTEETSESVEKIRSGIGDSSAVTGAVKANTTWGNLVDLEDAVYGMDGIVVRPALLDIENGTISDNILSVPNFGPDGRISGMNRMVFSRVRSEDGFFEDYGYGVRAIGSVIEDPLLAKEVIGSTCGYAIDLAVRTSEMNSHLLLQTDAVNRIYSDGAENTMGGGSYAQFTIADLSQENALWLLSAMRVAFIRPCPDGYKLLATAAPDTDAAAISGREYTAPLRLIDDPDNTARITALEKDQPMKITAVTYLDGRFVQNSVLAYSTELGMVGKLNLQFASDAELVPAKNSDVKNGNAEEARTEMSTVIAAGFVNEDESVAWSLDSDGKLVIAGSGAMASYEGDEKSPWEAWRSDIRSIVISDGITSVGGYAFADCTEAASVTIPDSVQGIEPYAFSNCAALTSVKIGSNTVGIGDYAFKNCTNLSEVTVETNTVSFGEGCFMDCAQLSTVFYSGTAAQWEAIEKAENWDTGVVDCLIRCSDSFYGTEVIADNTTAPEKPAEDPAEKPTEDEEATAEWKLYDNGLLLISGNGRMKAYKTAEDAPWHEQRSQIKRVIVEEGVTNVSGNSFSGCEALHQVVLSNTVRTIDENAFYNCDSLTEVMIPDSVLSIETSAFAGCDLLAEVAIGEQVKTIGDRAFEGTSISKLTLGNSVKHIGDRAFAGCNALAHVSIGYGLRTIGEEAFSDCSSLSAITYSGTKLKWWLFIGKGTDWDKNTGGYTFNCIDDLTMDATGTLESGVVWTLYDNSDDIDGLLCIDGNGALTEAPWREFAAQIRTIKIGEGITGICEDAFFGCTNLKTVDYAGTPEEWATIRFGNEYANPCALAGSLSIRGKLLKSLTFPNAKDEEGNPIPKAIQEISSYAFYNCNTLTELKIGDGVTSIGSHAFYGCDKLRSVSIPAGVINIGDGAFSACPQLKKITVDDKNKHFAQPDDAAVYSADRKTLLWCCSNVEGVFTIPDGVETVSADAFAACEKLTDISIPSSVKAFGENAFVGCDGLQSVTYGGTLSDWLLLQFANQYATPMKYAQTITLTAGSATDIVIPEGTVALPDFCFYGWNQIGSISLPASLQTIGTGALAACTGMSKIELDSLNTAFDLDYDDYRSIEYVLYSAGRENLLACSSGSKLELDTACDTIAPFALSDSSICEDYYDSSFANIITVGDHAFENCTNLSRIDFSDSLQSIGNSAFENCTALNTVIFSDGLKTIGTRAFENCANLFQVRLPSALQSLGANAFAGCGEFFMDYYGSRTQWSAVTKGLGWDVGSNPDVRTSGGDYGVYENLIWSLTKDGVLTVKGIDFMPSTASPWRYWGAIRSVVITDGVKNIGDRAFEYCGSLSSVKIPDSVGHIGEYAFSHSGLSSVELPGSVTKIERGVFYGCGSLSSVTIPDSIKSIDAYAFGNCDSLNSIKIPNSVRSVGEYAFSCSGLSSVEIPGSITKIEQGVFYDCDSLSSVTIPGSVRDIGNSAFGGCRELSSVTIPDSVRSIGDSAFSGCRKLSSITIPGGVKSIGAGAFEGCYEYRDNTGLASVTIMSGVENIGDSAFRGCGKLSSVTIPDSVTSIGENAFYNCSSLSNVTIPDGVKSIGSGAFAYCKGLSGIVIPDSVSSIGANAFGRCTMLTDIEVSEENSEYCAVDGVLYDKEKTLLSACPAGKSGDFVIPTGVKAIEAWAFNGCTGLDSITIPNGVAEIGQCAFFDCSGLSSVSIPSDVKSIERNVFNNCAGLRSIMIPDGVENIYEYAFSGCTGLRSIRIPASVKFISPSNGFGGCKDIYYAGTEEMWKSVFNRSLAGVTIHYNS